MIFIGRLLRNRNFIFLLAIAVGFAVGEGVTTQLQPTMLPLLALVMTLSTTAITSHDLVVLKTMPRTIITSLVLNYIIMGGSTILLANFLIDDSALRAGLIIVAAVPPAVAVVPFSYMLGGNTTHSLTGLVATYLAALILTPVILLLFLDIGFFNPIQLLPTLGQLIVLPLILSRILILTGLTRNIQKWRGAAINWTFFVVVLTIIGLNRQVFFSDFNILLNVALIAVLITFILGFVIESIAKAQHLDQGSKVNWILFGTKKNYGLASVIALTLLDERAAIPGAICLVFAILHTVSLSFRYKKGK